MKKEKRMQKTKNKVTTKQNSLISKSTNAKETKKQHGISIVALVVTIIVLLILVSITLSTITGKNGIFEKTEETEEETEKTEITALVQLEALQTYTEKGGFDSESFKEKVNKHLAKHNPSINENDESIIVTIKGHDVVIDKENGEIIDAPQTSTGTYPKVETDTYQIDGTQIEEKEIYEEVILATKITNRYVFDTCKITLTDSKGNTIEANKNTIGIGDSNHAIIRNGQYVLTVKGTKNGQERTVRKTINITCTDNTVPNVIFNPDGGANYVMPTTGNATIETEITSDKPNKKAITYQYAWSTSSTEAPTEWQETTSIAKISKTDCTVGSYYLWIQVNDEKQVLETKTYTSKAFVINPNTSEVGKITLTPNTTEATNKNVTVTVTYGEKLTQNRTLTCTGTENVDYIRKGTNSIEVITNGQTITASATDIIGNKVTETITITNIDKIIPTVNITPNSGSYVIPVEKTTINISAKLTAKDEGGSQLDKLEYAWSTSNTEEPQSGWKTFTNESTITDAIPGGTHYLWTKVIDAAGNRAEETKVSNPYVVKYQIKYDANGGTGEPEETIKEHDTNLTLSTKQPTRTGYTFNGWSTNKTATTAEYQPGATYSANSAKTLYAVWAANQYTVTLNNQSATTAGSTAVYERYATGIYLDTAQTKAMTATANPITVPQRAYTVTYNYNGNGATNTTATATYTFGGYYTEANGGGTQRIAANGHITSNFANTSYSANGTLYAKWTSAAVTLPTPTRTGYTFAGWYTAASGGTKVGAAGESYTPTAGITLYAQWTANQYTITLNNQSATTAGSTAVYERYATGIYLDTAQTKAMTTSANAITKPQRAYTITYNYNGSGAANTTATGTYTFGGYYTSTGGGGTQRINENGYITSNFANTSYSANGTLYAKWTGGTVTTPKPTRTGYTFAGWYAEAACTTKVVDGGVSYTTTATKTLYAKWTANQYTVTLNNQGATTAGTTAIYERYGKGVYLDAAETKEITTSGNGITKPQRAYTVTYNYNGNGTANTTATATYQFGGYYTQTGGNGTQEIGTNAYITTNFTSTTFSSNATLYAKWTSSAVTLPTPTRTGYTFAGWYTAASGGTKVGAGGASYTPTSTLTLYAQWTANQYTVTLNNQSATTAGSTAVYERYGKGVYLDTAETKAMTTSANAITKPQRTYTVTYNYNGNGTANSTATSTYTFGGYYTATNGGGTQRINENGYITSNFANTSYSTNGTLYAKWTGGTVTLPTPTRTGYTFAGWYTTASGGTKVGDGGASYAPTANATIYAQWTINSYTIDLNMTVDGTAYNSGYNDLIYVGLKIGGVDKGYVKDYCTSHTYGTSWEIYGIKINGTTLTYSSKGTLGAENKDLRVTFYTTTFTANSGTYGSVSTGSYIVWAGQTYSTSGGTLTLGDGRTVTASTKSVTGYTSNFTGWSSTSGTINATTTITANFTGTINSYNIDLNYTVDGTAYNSGYNSRIYVGLKVAGVDKGYVQDYYTQHTYGTKWEIYGFKLDGTTISYSASGTLGAGNLDLRRTFYTITINPNNSSYGTVSNSSVIVWPGETYSTSGNTLSISDGRTVTATVTNLTGATTTFSSWSPTSGTVNAATTVTANFTRKDVTAPTMGNATAAASSATKFKITVSSVADTGGSGLKGYYYSTSSTTPTTSSSWTSSTASSFSFTGNESTTYYIWVIDNAGNISSVKTITTAALNYSVNNTSWYTTLKQAVSACAASGSTIYLLNDYTDSSAVTIAKSLTLNTNGKTLTRDVQIAINSGYTVTLNGNGTIKTSKALELIYNNGATLNVENIKFNKSGDDDIIVTMAGTTNIKAGASLTTTGGPALGVRSGATVNITGGTILSNTANGNSGQAIVNRGTVNISRGTISSTGTSNTITNYESNASLKITGGTISASQGNTIANGSKGNARVYITGGTITNSSSNATIANWSTYAWPTSGTTICSVECTIHIGGSAIVKNTGSGYAIANHGGGIIHTPKAYTGYIYAKNNYVLYSSSSSYKMTINGGTLYAQKGSSYYKSGSGITIGSDVTKKATAP